MIIHSTLIHFKLMHCFSVAEYRGSTFSLQFLYLKFFLSVIKCLECV